MESAPSPGVSPGGCDLAEQGPMLPGGLAKTGVIASGAERRRSAERAKPRQVHPGCRADGIRNSLRGVRSAPDGPGVSDYAHYSSGTVCQERLVLSPHSDWRA